MTRVGIVGLGFVGKAIAQFFQANSPKVELRFYDKYKAHGIGQISEILHTDLVFLCLPTQYDTKLERYDILALESTCAYLNDHLYDGIVIVKSTVLPKTCQMLADKYFLKIIHNPEFLTARTAVQDFANQQHIVLGTTTLVNARELEFIKNFYQQYFPEALISCTIATQSEAMKVFCNSFYAAKVQIFNEFYLLCQNLEIDYNDVLNLMLENNWINPMHTQVPGPDGRLSFGGLCFTKDIKALISQMKRMGTEHAVLEAVINERDQMRND